MRPFTIASRRLRIVAGVGAVALLAGTVMISAQQGGGTNPFPGGTNPDGSLRPSAPVSRLFTQDAYTEYALLEPGSESFRIRSCRKRRRVGATELVNATRGGSEGSGIEVYDPRTGKPLEFTYAQQSATIPRATRFARSCRVPVPEGGIGRVLIYKTYKDPRTYMMNGEDIVWVRSLSGYRLGVVLPKGFAFLSSNVAAQLSTTADGRLKLAFANPSGQSNPVTIHARKTTAEFAADAVHRHVLRRHQDALRPRRAGDAARSRRADLQRLPQGRAGASRFAGLSRAAGSQGRSISIRRRR